MKLLLTLFLLFTISNASDKLETVKTSCLQQSAYPNKTLAEQKKILIEKAKQESLEELYGTLISSSIDIENGRLKSDKIRSRAVGAVRVNGNPSFYNGKNLGEICTDVNVYITKKDLEKYSPKKVSLKHFCFNDPAVAMKDIKQEAKYGAYKEIISQYKASLKLDGKTAEKYIHEFTISNDKFDFDTASYCFNAVATVLPYELEMGKSTNEKKVASKNNNKSKLNHTLYGKWYGSYYWNGIKEFGNLELNIKNDGTYDAKQYYPKYKVITLVSGTVMHNGNTVILLPNSKEFKNTIKGSTKGWTTDTLQLLFNKETLLLSGKIMNSSKSTGAQFHKVNLFPSESEINNPENLIDGFWYGTAECSGNFYTISANFSQSKNILYWSQTHNRTAEYKVDLFKTANKIVVLPTNKLTDWYDNGEYKQNWNTDGFNGIINGNRIHGDLTVDCKGEINLKKVSILPPKYTH